MRQVLVLNPKDNIAICLTDMKANQELDQDNLKLTFKQAIPRGHKVATADIKKGDGIIKYGERMGHATKDISRGVLVIQESGGATGTFESGIKDARQLRADFPTQKAEVEKLIVGLDIARDISNTADIKAALTKAGFEVVIQEQRAASEHNLAKLMGQKAHLILSYPDENQPPSGFPLIPVINIASTSPLHQALISEFDLTQGSSSEEIIDLIIKVANGQKSKSEISGIGEIVAPRAVRSV
ncbi:MAG: hypothetical protein EB129_05260 [Actinobacteria bacterium]|nr:hypothetical protein [Actinomycetota bacterium]